VAVGMLQNVDTYMQRYTFHHMSETFTQRERVLQLLGRHGILRLSELKAHGVHAPTLSRLVEEGLILRSSRGLYQLSDADVDIPHSLAEMAKRAPRGVVCLISALQYHEITLQSPRSVWMAIGARDRKPKISNVSVRFVRFGEKAMATGVTIHTIDLVPVPIFDPAKTVVDCFRFRGTVGLDVALESLRMVLRSRKATLDQIAATAKELRIWTVIRPYLESIAADDA
jgi:predicted transcriptional regulator of viral defense system